MVIIVGILAKGVDKISLLCYTIYSVVNASLEVIFCPVVYGITGEKGFQGGRIVGVGLRLAEFFIDLCLLAWVYPHCTQKEVVL